MELGIVTILINGLLSMSELAIVSSRPARLAGLVEKGVTSMLMGGVSKSSISTGVVSTRCLRKPTPELD